MELLWSFTVWQNYHYQMTFASKNVVFSILPTSRDFIKQLNTIISNFLWKGPGKIPVVRQMQLTI